MKGNKFKKHLLQLLDNHAARLAKCLHTHGHWLKVILPTTILTTTLE